VRQLSGVERRATEEIKRKRHEANMDITPYCGAAFISLGDVQSGPIHGKIAAVNLSKYNRPVLVFESGAQLSLNVTNSNALQKVYGADTDSWIGHVVEMYLGMLPYQGQQQEGVRVKALSRPEPSQDSEPKPEKAKTATKRRGDLDDEIPF
jgi:hypothetical protein